MRPIFEKLYVTADTVSQLKIEIETGVTRQNQFLKFSVGLAKISPRAVKVKQRYRSKLKAAIA